MNFLIKYRFFALIGIYVLLQVFDKTEFATIAFFILILDLANALNQSTDKDSKINERH